MFKAKTKPTPPKRDRKAGENQLGIFGLGADDDDDDAGGLSDGADSDLERELAAITSGGRPKAPKRAAPAKPKVNLDQMMAESLRDFGSDEELSGDDEDFMGELEEITGGEVTASPPPPPTSTEEPKIILPTSSEGIVDTLKGRLKNYEKAEAIAKNANESTKARRYNRAIKTLKDLLKQAEKGKKIDPSEIPPEVFVKDDAGDASGPTPEPENLPPAVPARKAPSAPPSMPPPELPKESTSEEPKEDPRMKLLNQKKDEFKKAALEAKKSGDTVTAMKYIKIMKQFDTVIEALKNGQEVDLSQMPSLPSKKPSTPAPEVAPNEPQKEESENQTHATATEEGPEPEPVALIKAKTVLEGLQQHMEKWKEIESKSKEEGNSSKARRIGRLVKTFEGAIKTHKAGKPLNLDELPVPPGHAPLPIAPTASPVAPVTPKPAPAAPPVASPSNNVGPAPSPRPSPSSSHPPPEQTRISGNAKNTTLMDKQVAFLVQRQAEFKKAAIEAKKSGEIDQAKEYLRIFKGLEQLVEHARCGLPIDMATVPIPPSKRSNLEEGFTVVSAVDVAEIADETIDIRVRLEEQLSKQLMMCKNTRDHHRAMGDVAGTNRFENLALQVQKDLDFVRLAHRQGLPIPKFHYEQKVFNIVKCNVDVSENEVEIHVVRGISYIVANARDVDTYVKVEFPWPQDAPYKAKTKVVNDTDSPEYNQKFCVEIQRNNKQCTRIFKRQQIKLEVFSKGGFLRSDTLIGTVNIKIQPLETTCDIHDSFPLMDGRRPNGGKLEVKIRVRNPILTKQMEQINEKWVVMDQ